jgi:hypothetical protein
VSTAATGNALLCASLQQLDGTSEAEAKQKKAYSRPCCELVLSQRTACPAATLLLLLLLLWQQQ